MIDSHCAVRPKLGKPIDKEIERERERNEEIWPHGPNKIKQEMAIVMASATWDDFFFIRPYLSRLARFDTAKELFARKSIDPLSVSFERGCLVACYAFLSSCLTSVGNSPWRVSFLFFSHLIEWFIYGYNHLVCLMSYAQVVMAHIPYRANNGLMVHCLGYEGKFCEEQYNACDSMVCHNGGSCLIAHDGRAHCSCPSGFVGLHCEEELTGCDSSPCVHGICVDQTHGYRCFCQPGKHLTYFRTWHPYPIGCHRRSLMKVFVSVGCCGCAAVL